MASKNKVNGKRYIEEDDNYWYQQRALVEASGLTRKAWCRANGVNYDRFGYWLRHQKRLTPKRLPLLTAQATPSDKNPPQKRPESVKPFPLVAVQVTTSAEGSCEKVLATLRLKNGAEVKVHDLEALCMLAGQV